MPQRTLLVLFTLFFALGAALAQTPEWSPETAPPAEDANAAQAVPATEPEAPPQPLSDAEKIARLQRSVERLRKRVDDLRAQLNAPETEYNQAEAEFTALDEQLQTRKKELQKRRAEGAEEAATTQEAELKDLETKWRLAKDRFDLAIQERKTLQEQIATFEQSAQRNAEALKKLKGEAENVATTQPGPAQPAATPPTGVPSPEAAAQGPVATAPGQPAPPTQPIPGGAAGPTAAAAEGPSSASGQGAAAVQSGPSDLTAPPSEELLRAGASDPKTG